MCLFYTTTRSCTGTSAFFKQTEWSLLPQNEFGREWEKQLIAFSLKIIWNIVSGQNVGFVRSRSFIDSLEVEKKQWFWGIFFSKSIRYFPKYTTSITKIVFRKGLTVFEKKKYVVKPPFTALKIQLKWKWNKSQR